MDPSKKTDRIDCTFLWTIENFSWYQEEKRKCLQSSSFSSPTNDKLRWYLRLFPNGTGDNCEGFLSLFLCLDSTLRNINTTFKLSIIDVDREVAIVQKTKRRFYEVESNDWGWHKFVKRDTLLDKKQELLPNDQLTILCQLSVLSDCVEIVGQNNAVLFDIPECTWVEDMGLMLENQKFSDVTLKAGDYTVQAHKNILAARSKVFDARFTSSQTEKTEGFTVIEDLEPEVLRELVKFIYLGSCLDLTGMADRLLSVADRYGLERLKNMCERSLILHLTVENSAEILVLADSHSAERLKDFCMDFIKAHSSLVISTEGWKSSLALRPQLVAEILCKWTADEAPHCGTVISEIGDIIFARSWCHTKNDLTHFSFKWTINRYTISDFHVKDFLSCSPVSAEPSIGLKWVLEAFPNGVSEDSKGHLSIFLKLLSSDRTVVNTVFKLSLLGVPGGEKLNTREYSFKFVQGVREGSDRFIKNSLLLQNNQLKGEQLTILCEIAIIESTLVISGKNESFLYWDPSDRWIEDMESLIGSQKFSDVVLKADGHEIKAHKNILAARSPVFSAMFEHEMKESKESLVEIEDTDPEVLKEMLRFIYTGQSPNLDSMAERLLPAADKYGLERLKVLCEVSLASNLTPENVLEVLELADTHTALQLKAHTVKFFVDHCRDLAGVKDWLSKMLLRPNLIIELFEAQASGGKVEMPCPHTSTDQQTDCDEGWKTL
ncbi:SPOPL [Cordylochernes scorpioides]|uniref:SPOPL n=1 Tax=Cordylochernes scorpioides TaxID=51811 RepID=A0ABY6KLQ2_9ARAC|nr:SPOPL [Cordylochernes scorpioides]